MVTSIHIAESVEASDFPYPPDIIAGDTPAIVTADRLLPSGALAQYVPLGPDFTPWAAGEEIRAMTTYATPGGQRAGLYLAGMFNIDQVAWPVGTTEAQIEAAMTGMMQFRKKLWSNKRTGNEVLGRVAGSPDTLTATPADGALTTQAAGALSGRTFAAAGGTGPYSYKNETALPAGTSLNASTGAWTGTIASGTHSFVISYKDSSGKQGVSQYSIVVT